MGLRSTKFITYRGGNCNNTTANYGTFSLNLNNTTSNANWNIDASILIHKLLDNVLRKPYLSVKMNSLKRLLVASRTWSRG